MILKTKISFGSFVLCFYPIATVLAVKSNYWFWRVFKISSFWLAMTSFWVMLEMTVVCFGKYVMVLVDCGWSWLIAAKAGFFVCGRGRRGYTLVLVGSLRWLGVIVVLVLAGFSWFWVVTGSMDNCDWF